MAAGASYDWTLQLGFSGQAPSVFDCTAGVLRRVGDWPKGMPDLHVWTNLKVHQHALSYRD